jgi:hypothetical protein
MRSGSGGMQRNAAMISMLTMSALAATAAHATGVTAYGAGLESCKAYLEARHQGDATQVAYVDWLGGYFSGVNKTSRHRNNFFGLSDLQGALSWLDDYCNARPRAYFAEAVGTLLLSGKPGPAAHSIEANSYGSADKSCDTYLEAREQRDIAYRDAAAEFTNWLGGYLSGVNATSLDTNNVLGKSELSDAVQWLEKYCGAHSLTSFGVAVDALVLAQQARYASQPSATPGP